jgi:hypothetical protein
MNAETNCKSYGFRAKAAAAILAFAIGAVPGALAGPSSKVSVPEPGAVISHVEMAGGPAARMRLVKKDGKWLLFVEMGSGQAVRVVDVTTPEQAAALEQAGATGRVPRLSAAIAAERSPELLQLLNSIGASDPKQAHRFSGSARFVADVPHKLIFVVDGEGLWIVKAKESVASYVAVSEYTDLDWIYGGGG